jgi:signal transduction histidine kinase
MRRVYPLPQLILAVLAAFGLSMLVIVPILQPPAADIQQLFMYMTATGLATILLVYAVYRLGFLQRLISLRWTLAVIIAMTILLIFANVWVTAQLMFISQHDLVLTTGLLVFAGVIAAIAALVVASALRERIHHLAGGVRALAQGRLETRLRASGNDELAQLETMFNQTAARLQALDAQKRELDQMRRDLIAWVSHDLRTPLAAMRAMNESLLDGVVSDPQTTQRYLRDIQAEMQHLGQLIDDLFELAQVETERLPLNRQVISLRDLISDTLSGLGTRADSQGVTIEAHISPEVDVAHLAPDKIQRVLYNLLDNALAYTPVGGRVTLQAARRGDAVEIQVHNTGSHIDSGDLPRVFESFYRGEQSRSRRERERRGTGLGLAIVRGFIEAHGGAVKVQSSPESGTTFTCTLPTQG